MVEGGEEMKVKTYTIKVTEKDDMKVSVTRTCDGFTAHELLGHLWVAQHDLLQQIRGPLPQYETIKRRVVQREGKK